MRALVGILQLATGMALFGSATPVAKLVGAELPTFIGSGLRVLLGTLVLLPFAWSDRDAIRQASARAWWQMALIAAAGIFGFTVLLLVGMRQVSGVVGSIVMSATPAVTAMGAFLVFRDPLGWQRLTAIGLAVLGVMVLHAGDSGSGSGGGALVLGSLLVFGAVCCETVYTLTGKAAVGRLPPLGVACVSCAMAIPLFAAAALVAGEFRSFVPGRVTPGGWLAVLWWGAGTLAAGSALWYSGLSKARGSTAAGFMGVMPVSALVLSYVLLGEPFRWMHLAGFGIVFAGVLLISYSHVREMSDTKS